MQRLNKFLIAKAMLETLFVGALAMGFYLAAFPPFFRGALDEAIAAGVAGWAVNEAAPQERVALQLYIDGRFIAHTVADKARPDVLAAGRATDELCGFVFRGPFTLDAGTHEARVYALHASGDGTRQTLQLIGKPLNFQQ